MIETARHLKETISKATPLLRKISEKEALVKPAEQKWSKKEILGHLIDSASNNHQKFVRLMEQETLHFEGYQQDFWVSSQRYNYAPWESLIFLWESYNYHIAHIIEYVMPDKLANKIYISGNGPYSLEFIMKDYVEHLLHHLKQLLPNERIESKFENIYNS